MLYRDVNLVLDNFRSVLKDYDVDIQDVVRSSILDGVDVSEYIEPCREDPYKLDQVRLSLKEGVPTVLLSGLSGEQLYIIRKMKAKNYNIEPVISQITSGKLSECYLDFLISWVTKGVDISGIKLSLIPKKMLEIFDTHLCQGRDMKPFNNGRVYSKEYVLYCMSIQDKGKDISKFAAEDWSIDVLKLLSGLVNGVSDKVWKLVVSCISVNDSAARISSLFSAARYKLPIEKLNQVRQSAYLYSDMDISLILEAAKNGFDWKTVMSESLSTEQRRAKLDEMKMLKGKKVGGVLRRG